MELNDAFEKEGIKLAPGTGFYCEEFGWFRLTFAKPRDELEKGLLVFFLDVLMSHTGLNILVRNCTFKNVDLSLFYRPKNY